MKKGARTTHVLCKNASGTDKIPRTIVGVFKNPVFIEGKSNPCIYFDSETVSLRGSLFEN